MPFHRKATLNFSLLIFFALLILSAPPAAARIILEPRVGFNGLFHLGQPFPLTVEVTNSGRPVDGTLEARVWKGGPSKGAGFYSFYYRKDLFLPAQSRQSVQFTVDPDSLSRPLALTFSSPGETVVKEIDLRRHFSPSPLILLLTGESTSPAIFSPSGSLKSLVSLTLKDLPSDARGYRGVWTVILYEQPLRDLSNAQVAALETWISSGGRMLILGSLHYALYRGTPIDRFLPVRVLGLKKFSSLPNLARTYERGLTPGGHLLVQDSKLTEGRVVLEEGGTPILVEVPRGKGKVSYLSLDLGRPPLARWEGLPLLFQDLLGAPPEKGTGWRARWNETTFSQVLSSHAFLITHAPVLSFSLWTLLYLGGLAVLAWCWRQQRFRRSTLLGGFFSWILLCTLAGYLHFDRAEIFPDGLLISSTVLDGLGDGYAEAQSSMALFSTRRREYSLRMKPGWTDIEMVAHGSQRVEETPAVIEQEAFSTAVHFPLREWNYKLLRVQSMSRLPLRTEVEHRGDRLFLRLTNLGSHGLTECWLLISGQRVSLGDIAPGASQVRELSLSSADQSESGRGTKRGLWDISFSDKTREALFRHAFFPQEQGTERWVSGAVLVLGWVQDESPRVWVDDARVSAHDYVLFRVIVPVDLEGEL